MFARGIVRRRVIGRSIARAAVTTAVVVGTAGVVSHHQQQKYANQAAAEQQKYDQAYAQGVSAAQAQQPTYAPPPPPATAAAPAPADDLTSKLQQLGHLHDSGVLTDEEFAAAKQRLLGS